MIALGVNVDHVATLREVRRDVVPSPLEAALLAEAGGASCITVHLREDRRHIQDDDIIQLKKRIQTHLNLEMSVSEPVVRFAQRICPAQATLVPEKRNELTTEGGLDVRKGLARIADVVKRLQKKGIIVSLFINPNLLQIRASRQAGANCIEIHTGHYANAGLRRQKTELAAIREAVRAAMQIGLGVHAGHGLTYGNVAAISRISGIEELNIGHNIVARSVIVGMRQAVREMLSAMKGTRTNRC